MRKIKEVLRLRSLGLNQHQIARGCSIAQSTVHEYCKAAEAAGIDWPVPAEWDDRRLEEVLFPRRRQPCGRRRQATPDFTTLHQELQSHKQTACLPHCTTANAARSRAVSPVAPGGHAGVRFRSLRTPRE
jgi:transposase